MNISPSTNQQEWDAFLTSQQFRPFLQSWTMGEVYRRIGQDPIRLVLKDGDATTGLCFAHIVPARRGRHLSVPYGPVLSNPDDLPTIIAALKEEARKHRCTFLRISPFLPAEVSQPAHWPPKDSLSSPLHLLAEHLWYLPLQTPDSWQSSPAIRHPPSAIVADTHFKNMRSTARNLIRRAEKEGVTIEASSNPIADLNHFITLHEETRKRHGFTPYTNAFFRAQVEEFTKTDAVTLYLAHYQNEVIAASIHMRFGGETSYHHGASTHRFSKIPSSYLLQWTAIQDALARGDRVYNFWGIAPGEMDPSTGSGGKWKVENTKHPFAGVTTFKTGFGGNVLNLVHCVDVPLSAKYYVTRMIENIRKWRRGF